MGSIDKSQTKRIIIAGGGISGLTLTALLCQFNDVHVTVFERSVDCCKTTAGGGIGLWENSVNTLSFVPNVKEYLLEKGYWMPFPSYRDSEGRILARGSDTFHERFPVLCLQRDDILRPLYVECMKKKDVVTIVNNVAVVSYELLENHGGVKALLSNGTSISGDILIAADGIHSVIRSQMLSKLHPTIKEKACGYTYFRANAVMKESDSVHWHEASFEAWGCALKNSYPLRFGYVPLKKPEVFWFIAIPLGANSIEPQQNKSVSLVDENTKQWLISLLRDWKNPTNASNHVLVDYVTLLERSTHIIRTDIYKIPNVSEFPWTDGPVVLLGDACHATAPNIAQGAGLCIEDCALLCKLVTSLPRRALLDAGFHHAWAKVYEKQRKQRASTVQFYADAVAWVGGLKSPLLMAFRNLFMRAASTLFPTAQQTIFELVVSHSLGGDFINRRIWRLPNVNTRARQSFAEGSCLLGQVLSKDAMSRLAPHVRHFKSSAVGGKGFGTVSVERGNWLARALAWAFQLPQEMKQQRFLACVTTAGPNEQVWTRVFAVGDAKKQLRYSTTHWLHLGARGTWYSEGVGGVLDRLVRFLYKVEVVDGGALAFESVGLSLCGIALRLPKFLLLESRWVETPTEGGWLFDGEIKAPLVGRLMRYYGEFHIELPRRDETQDFTFAAMKKVFVAGGTGLLGKKVCECFLLNGWKVFVLTRNAEASFYSPHEEVSYVHYSSNWDELLDENSVVLNLAGESPGTQRWTASVKDRILSSRLSVISNQIGRALAKCAGRNVAIRSFMQASAAGVYGSLGEEEIGDLSDRVVLVGEVKNPGTKFRVECCKEIEAAATRVHENATLLRIGHVLSNEGGLYPYMNLASLVLARKFSTGRQFIPWIHEDDLAAAIVFIAENPSDFQGAPVNLSAPLSCTNLEFLTTLAKVKGRFPGIVSLPEIILNILIGESACVLYDSERMVPEKLLSNKFTFKYTKIEDALMSLL